MPDDEIVNGQADRAIYAAKQLGNGRYMVRGANVVV
jgi:hypothetical protein